MKRIAIALFLGLSSGQAVARTSQAPSWICEAPVPGQQKPTGAREAYSYVSMVQLIANPEKYDGKLVCVAGFLDIEYDATVVYQHREDSENALDQNGIWLDPGDLDASGIRPMSKRYVWLLGRFRAGPLFGPPAAAPGPPSNINVIGGLTEIRKIVEALSSAQPEPPHIWVPPSGKERGR